MKRFVSWAQANKKAATLAAVVIIGGGAGVTKACTCAIPTFGGGSPPAADLYVAMTGSDSNACTSSGSPCATLDGAVQKASAGNTISVAAGIYSGNVIQTNNALRNLTPACDPYGQWGAVSTTNCVQIVPAGALTFNGSVEIHASDLWLKGTTTGVITSPRARTFNIRVNGYIDTEADSSTVYPEHDTIEGVHSVQVGTNSSKNIYLLNMDAGPETLGAGCVPVESDGGALPENQVALNGGVAVTPIGIVWNGMFLHNQERNQAGKDADCHGGGMFIKCTTGFILRNSVFEQDFVYDVQEQDVCGLGAQASNVTMENNWFGCPVDSIPDDGGNGVNTCDGQADVQFNASGEYDNHLYRFNSMMDGFGCSGLSCAFSNVRFIGNAGSVSTNQVCGVTGTTWAYNAWVGTSGGNTTCGPTDVSVASGNNLSLLFNTITIGSENLHLVNGTVAANNMVTPTSPDYSLAADIDGDARTAGSRDAGSDEQ